MFQELLEKILKPAKAIKTDVKSTVSATTNNSAPKNVFKIDEPRIESEEIKEEDSNDNHFQVDHFGDDIDFSGLDNDDTKLEEKDTAVHVDMKIPEPVAKESEPTDVTSKTVIKSADIFENIRPNWDNAFKMEDDDDDELLSAVADEAMSVDAKQVDMKFWYWDAWEDPTIPGQIFLFGKIASDANARTPEYKSICVKVENVDYCISVLPREFVRAI